MTTLSRLAALVLSGFALLSTAACVGSSGSEATGESGEAQTKVGQGPTVTMTCGTPQPLGGDAFENALLALGCNDTKTSFSVSSTPGTTYSQTICPTDTTTTAACPDGSRVVDVVELVACFANQAPIYAQDLGSQSYCGGTVRLGDAVVAFDPNCTGGGCARVNIQ